jgi:predicted metal-binding membrane protein
VSREAGRLPPLELAERVWLAAGVLAVSLLAWIYTVRMALTMSGQALPMAEGMDHHGAMTAHGAMAAAASPHLGGWAPGATWMTFTMWTVMMAAMMLPTAVPMVLAFATVNRGQGEQGAVVPIGAFVVGYLGAWTAYSGGATAAQWGLERAALLSAATLAAGPALGGALLIAAGLFQWSPWKDACMTRCRHPLGFLLTHWRPGLGGAVRLGAAYGLYCVGCCWLLMALSFALGVMNLAWMAAVTVLMIAEKVAPAGRLLSRAAGVAFVGWGVFLLVG